MITNRCWERAPFRTGCATLRTVGQWWISTPFGTTSVCGVASLITKAQDQIAPQQRPAGLRRASVRCPFQDCPKTLLDELDKVEKHLNQGKAFAEWLGICVYEPEWTEAGEVVWHFKRNAPAKLKNILSIGVFDGHAFLTKENERLASVYACAHCCARITKVCNLQRHTQRCSRGETRIICPNEKVEAPQTIFEQAFFPDKTVYTWPTNWLEREARRRQIHIHHAMCGHGGERWVAGDSVDGFHLAIKIVFQYHGCHFHGCPNAFLIVTQLSETEKPAKIFSKPL